RLSLFPQTIALGLIGSTISWDLGISVPLLVLTALPHALVELTAVFLPLAAWTLASLRGEWDQLLAATFVTVAIAIPMLIVAATWGVYVWPHILPSRAPPQGIRGGPPTGAGGLPQRVDLPPLGRLVVAPADNLRAVANTAAARVVVGDLDHQLGPQLSPLELPAGVPATGIARALLAGL